MTIKDQKPNSGTKLIGQISQAAAYLPGDSRGGRQDSATSWKTDGNSRVPRQPGWPSRVMPATAGSSGVWPQTETPAAEPQKPGMPMPRKAPARRKPESAPAAKPGDAPETEAAPAAPEATTAKKQLQAHSQSERSLRKARPAGICQECGESFLAPYGEIPTACPQGHKA